MFYTFEHLKRQLNYRILSDNDIKLDSFYENNNNYPENDNNYPEMIQEYNFYKCLNVNNNYINYLKFINFESKNNNLLETYYRITNNNYILLYTAINNFTKIKQIYSSISKDNRDNRDNRDNGDNGDNVTEVECENM